MTRRAVVTGASSGIGAATVRTLRTAGWDVVAVARRADRLQALAQETGAEAIATDLTDDDAVTSLRDQVAAGGPVHAVVNNAGGALGLDSVESAPLEDWARMYDLNVLTVKRMATAFLPLLRESIADAGSAGAADFLTITSTAARTPYEGGAGYNAAKAAATMLMGVLRLELAGEPIRVVEIAPGIVATEEFSLTRFSGDAERAAAVYADIDHPLVADDVADTIASTLALPWHVNLDLVVVKPIAQAAQHKIIRRPFEVADPRSRTS